jgi:hypothetical protein
MASEYTGSYPFLHIAKTRQLPYEYVLSYADYARFVNFNTGPSAMGRIDSEGFRAIGVDAAYEIMAAVKQQEAIRRGEIAPW